MKSIFITGAATGIGCCTAHKLHNLGWEVYAGIMPGQDSSEIKKGMSDRLKVIEIDVSDTESVKNAFNKVNKLISGKGLSAIHNNAGVANIATGVLAGASIEQTKKIIDINALGMMRVVQSFLPLLHLQKDARIINMSSSAARVAVPTAGTYMMSKMCVEAFTRVLRMELAPWGIQVCCIEPGAVKTPMTHNGEENMINNWKALPQDVQDRYMSVLIETNRRLGKQLVDPNPPELIADGIIDALTSKKMKIRYTIGKEVKYLPISQRLMSEEMFESILMSQFGLKRNSEVK